MRFVCGHCRHLSDEEIAAWARFYPKVHSSDVMAHESGLLTPDEWAGLDENGFAGVGWLTTQPYAANVRMDRLPGLAEKLGRHGIGLAAMLPYSPHHPGKTVGFVFVVEDVDAFEKAALSNWKGSDEQRKAVAALIQRIRVKSRDPRAMIQDAIATTCR